MSGGYRKYLESILPLLAADPQVSSLELSSPEELDFQGDPQVPHWRWPAGDARAGHAALRAHLRRRAPDVVFVPSARMVQTGLPTVVMVRNMEPLVAPFAGNSPGDGARNLARRLAARSASRRADRVIAVSDFVRDFLMAKWHIGGERIGVVPHGVEAPVPPGERARPAALTAECRGAMLFTAGSVRPARGLEDAIGALALLAARGAPAHLVIAGKVAGDAESYHARLQALVARQGLADRVVWAGSLTAREMGWCFANCAAFVMTSRVEACPNTALEALSYGAPCIATTNRPMPETFESAATYYPAGDAGALAARIADVLAFTPAEREEASRRARSRAGAFTWDATCRDTVRQLALAMRR